MSRRTRRSESSLPAPNFFDLAGSDPDLLNSGRIPDPQPEHTPLFRWLARVLTAVEARLRANGDATLRNALRFFWVLVMGAGVFLMLGPVLNPPMSFDDVIDSADIDEVDWVARDAKLDYVIGRTDDGGFSARVTESYEADFRNGPESSVERVIVTEFQGHDVRLEVAGATVDGDAADVKITPKSTTTELRITRTDGEPFAGTERISLSYELHDLITSEVDEATGAVVDRFRWSLFAPTWPQATKGVEVSLTLPAEINDALVRAPRGSIAWLISASTWLTPDRVTDDGATVYSFTNDQALPPNAEATLSASFADGTFVQPPTTPLYWVQTYGPLVPLVLLAVLVLFACAARRVVWADSAGDPWYLPRAEPPDGLTPDHAAQLRGCVRHAELVGTLGEAPAAASKRREEWLAAVARAARRSGRWGNLPSVVKRAVRWRAADAAVTNGLRWVPDSYVRDFFTFAPIALTLVQWGVLRQLSHQVILAIVWWPALFVVASTVLAVIAVSVVHRPRPLTREGALAVQQLKGIDVWARATRLLERGTVDDALLPYALPFVSARRAGRAVGELATQESGRRDIARGWRNEHVISGVSITATLAAAAVLAGSVVVVSTLPPPLAFEHEFVTDTDDLPGTFSTDVTGVEIAGELSRTAEGSAQVRVTERLNVRFDGNGSRVPQFAKEWPTERYDQSLGFRLDSVKIDGEAAPYVQRSQPATRTEAMVTQFSDVLDGNHEIEISYTLDSAAVRVPGDDGADQVRWSAWNAFLDTDYYRDVDDLDAGIAQIRPLRVQVTVASELVPEMGESGWIGSDPDRDFERDEDVLPLERGLVAAPWVHESQYTVDDALRTRLDLRIGAVQERADGALVATFDADQVQSRTREDRLEDTPAGPWGIDPDVNRALTRYDLGLTNDLGAVFDFPAGTFTDTSPAAAETYALGRALPYATVYALLLLVLLASSAVIVQCRRSRHRAPETRSASASLRTIAFVAIPLLALAQCVIFCWTVMPSSGGDSRGGWAMAAGAVMLIAVATEIVMVARRSLATAGKPRPKTSNGERSKSRKGAE
ncbi:DUF2207 domain-containing protein [Leucobacter japonicus]|uniref:DUF2207 domain-containing protein n=1 Tax=Leucobacter japonicus TaxID=1461259 RepID=UPI0009499090|nr:DUF2207 domain-containing protein [Leucobacter japonicus]